MSSTYDGPYIPSPYALRRRVPNCDHCRRPNPAHCIRFCSAACRKRRFAISQKIAAYRRGQRLDQTTTKE